MKKPTMRVRFNHIADPKVPLEANHEGENFVLHNGRIYELPVTFVEHLNQCAYPVYDTVEDPDSPTGIKVIKVGETPRFVCTPVLDEKEPEKEDDGEATVERDPKTGKFKKKK